MSSKSSNIAKRKYTVAKKVNGSRVYRKWSEWSEGDTIIGKYVETSIDNYKKPNYHIEIDEAQFKDRSAAAKFTGQTIALNANGMLTKAMDKVEIGSYVQIEYTGEGEIEKGPYAGKTAHKVEVSVLQVEEESEDMDVDL